MTTRANNSINSLLAAAIGLTLTAATVSADITYVDALEGSSGNTYATGGSLADTSWVVPGTSSVNETQWGDRAFANNATIFQGMHEVVTSDDMSELTTEITGLADGTYEIWAFYWDQTTSSSQNWTLSTGLTSGALTSYSSPDQPAVSGATTTGVSSAATLSFTTSVLTDEDSNRAMYGVNLGQVTVSGGSTVNVYADNLLGGGTRNRTWYDGVGYELVPEPPAGQITYIDAVEDPAGNTFATGGSLADTSWVEDPGAPTANETQWGKRTEIGGNRSTIFQASHTLDLDELPELTTQITELADGIYDIWAFFWDQVDSDTQNWTLSTGLTPGSLTSYSAPGEPAVAGAISTSVYNAVNLSFATVVTVVEGEGLRNLFGVHLGQTIVTGGSAVNVYVDNLIGNGSINRTWYDGVGYGLVSDPSSFAITSIDYMPGTDTVRLTWQFQPGEKFRVKKSTDMTNWDFDLGDEIDADAGVTTTRSFNVAGLDEGSGQLYFRVEK